MARRRGEPCFPIRAQWSDLELGDEHTHNVLQRHWTSDDMQFVEVDAAPGERIDLSVEG